MAEVMYIARVFPGWLPAGWRADVWTDEVTFQNDTAGTTRFVVEIPFVGIFIAAYTPFSELQTTSVPELGPYPTVLAAIAVLRLMT